MTTHAHTALAKLSTSHGRMVLDDQYKVEVFEVDSPHTFVQAVGYLKHLAGKRGHIVAFRGQRKLYGQVLTPTIFRGVTSQKMKSGREQALGSLLAQVRSGGQVLKHVGEHAREPLLQHYGINTRWIDLVDNVWVALWFACHRAHGMPKSPTFLHFERRAIDSKDENHYAYVLVVDIDRGAEVGGCRGLFHGTATQWIDLRIAVPSHFVRPHAQHGILFRKQSYSDYRQVDCANLVSGIVRVRLCDALDWLGSGRTLSIHSFFPPPLYDFGYRELLANMPPVPALLGAIQHIGA